MEEKPEEEKVALMRSLLPACLAIALLASSAPLPAEPLRLQLPTANDALLHDKPEDFYMYVDRNFEGEVTKPWSGGQYGFVRTMLRTSEGVLGIRFHEGIDIQPLERDSSQNPLDEVKSIATGVVAYVNSTAGNSNYGKYIVVEHNFGDGPVFSLYAHLSDTSVEAGQRVLGGAKLGKMGFTGAGINRTRAHVHLELALLLSLRFDDWHHTLYGTQNHHGIHNGMNLAGLDIAALYLALQENPDLSIPGFLSREPIYYKVTVARRGPLELVERYSWLKRGDHSRPSPSWEISFSASGIPLAVAPSNRNVSKPLITYVRTTQSRHEHHTSSRVSGTGRRASLTARGLQHLSLVTGDFPDSAKPQ